MSDAPPDPVPGPILEVLQVFSDLPDLVFGDLDKTALDHLAGEVRSHAADVERARDALAQASAALADSHATLSKRAEQGLRYARVYAADDEALSDRLAAIRLPAGRPSAKGAPKKAKTKKAADEGRAMAPKPARRSKPKPNRDAGALPLELVVEPDEADVSEAAAAP